MLAWTNAANAANAEFNIENNQDQPVNIKLGYQSVLNSSFIYTDVSKNVDLKKNIVIVPYGEVTVLLNPVLNNNNEIKGKDYYFISYQPKILLGKVSISFLLLFQMLEQLALVLFIMIIIFLFFQLKVIQILCPIMIQKNLKVIYMYLIKKV